MINVNDPLAAVRDELIHHADFAILVSRPFAALRTRVFIPICAAHNVRAPIVVHV